MWPERTEVQKIPREEDLDPSRVYAFRKFVQALLIPAGVVDMAALARRPAIPPRDVDAVRALLKSKDYTQEQGPRAGKRLDLFPEEVLGRSVRRRARLRLGGRLGHPQKRRVELTEVFEMFSVAVAGRALRQRVRR